MDTKRAVWLLSQMFLIQFDKEEHEALGMAIDALNENTVLKARLDKAVELPCEIGTVVYIPMVSKIGWWQEGYDYVYKVEERKFELCMINDFGKTVFYTKAEAQAKLDEMKGEVMH